jgi:hypothetical protein
MSKVKVGDRVKIVIEDDVIYVEPDGTVVLDGGSYCWKIGKNGLVSIEVIAPLFIFPTKKWAQVTADGYLWTLSASGMWVNLDGLGLAHATKLTESSHLRVISEGVDDE